jgi:hypothetical protein
MTTENIETSLVEGLELFNKELITSIKKAKALTSLVAEHINYESDRNKTLELYMGIADARSAISKIEKDLTQVKSHLSNVILQKLNDEQLSNFTYSGKKFYGSTTTRYNMGDRTIVENYILSTGPEALNLLGNTLNSEYITNFIESNKTVNPETGEELITLPPGINTYTTTTLNMRKS